MLGGQGEGQPHRHPLGDVVEGDGQHQQGGAAPGGGQALRLLGIGVEVGQQGIHSPKEQHPQHKAPRGGQPAGGAGGLGLLDGGEEQAEHRGRHHHPGGEPQKDPLEGWGGPSPDQ